jgi:Ca2+-binding RTX toxin-like protein
LAFGGSSRGVRVDLADGRAGGEGHDTIVGFHCVYGSKFGDAIAGTATRDGAWGGAGYDLLRMRAGSDSADGGLHADQIYLGPGLDYANGQHGWDRLYGGAGEDNLEGWSEGDYLNGGAGNDQLYAALFCAIGGNSYDTAGLWDDAGNELFGGPGDDYLVGDRGNDRLEGGPGYDRVQPGYRDGRVDWIASTEQLVEGCLGFPELERLFKQPGY